MTLSFLLFIGAALPVPYDVKTLLDLALGVLYYAFTAPLTEVIKNI